MGVRDESPLLAWEVDAQLISEAHAHHVVAPRVHSLLHSLVLAAVANHVIESPAEETVARRAHCRHEVKWRGVSMTAYVESPIGEAVMAWEGGTRGNDALGEECQSL